MKNQRQLKYQREADLEWPYRIAKMPGCENLFSCMQCGTCSGTCPLSLYMDYTPRRIVNLVRGGFRDDALASQTIWLCASCYSCAVRCPQDIRITDVTYNLKCEAIKRGLYPKRFPILVPAHEFYKMVSQRGRSSEMWNCCGATSYMSNDENRAFQLAARNLSLASRTGKADMLAPCSACYLVLRKIQDYIGKYPTICAQVEASLRSAGLEPPDGIKIRHPLEMMHKDIGPAAVKAKAVRKWKGGPVVCYYGCQAIRSYYEVDRPVHQTRMEELFEAAGIPAVDFALKTKCCGGLLTGTIHEVGLRLNYILSKEAVRMGAQALVTICPLCQFNLDAYQSEIRKTYHENLDLPITCTSRRYRAGRWAATSAPRGCSAASRAGARSGSGFPQERRRRSMPKLNGEARIGVYVCHCGTNIAGTIDVKAVAEYAATLPGVVVARDYKYMCSDPGQELIVKDIREHNLNRIVVASCSPLLHEHTFRTAVEKAGLNPYSTHMVNVREHDSWVHQDREAATEKARDLTRAAVRRVARHRPLEKSKVLIHPDGSSWAAASPASTPPSPWRMPASGSTWWSAIPSSAGTWRSSTRPSLRSTAPPASSPPK